MTAQPSGGGGMRVYLDGNGGRRLVGRADVPEGCGPVHEVPLFGAVFTIAESFAVGTETHLSGGGGAWVRSEAGSTQGVALPQVGAVEDGYRFKGGNPADPASWERVR